MAQVWSALGYAENGRFVADLVGDIFRLLDPQPGERVLDLGCGDGVLSLRIQEAGALVIGVDSSPELLKAAQTRGLDAQLGNGEQLAFNREFDAVFSNAALHWMLNQDAVLHGVHAALRPGGRFVAEMGGHGNVAAIRTALRAVVAQFGIEAEEHGSNVFFTPEEYTALLRRHSFKVEVMELKARPTPLPTGIVGWLETFRQSVLSQLPPPQRAEVVAQVSRLLEPVLRDRFGTWHADYVRLRFHAVAVSAS